MIVFLFLLCLSCGLAASELSVGYDFGQRYSHVRIFEYTDYSDVKFLKFDICGPTTLANWSISADTEGSCGNYLPKIHFDLQYGAYPLITPRNESFPDTYIASRHDLVVNIFNRTAANRTVLLDNPLRGTWFALMFVESPPINTKSRISASKCNIYLTTWLDYQAVPILLTLTIDRPLPIVLSRTTTYAYTSYYTAPGNSRLSILSNWSSNCDITILARINGLPSPAQYDYQAVCTNGLCSVELSQLAAFLWIYVRVSVDNTPCASDPLYGDILVRATECAPHSDDNTCIRSYPARRIMYNYYYDFIYIPVHVNHTNGSILLNKGNSSIYAYEFIVDDRNLGGTIHLDFRTQLKPLVTSDVNATILVCLSKNRPRRYDSCETGYKILLQKNSLIVRSLPYPEMAMWYLTFEYRCNDSQQQRDNGSMLISFQISSSQCTRDRCGAYGMCRIVTTQQNIFSTCACLAGYRGYGCTDGTFAHASRYLPSVLFLTLSNLMFIPAVIYAVYHRLYIEALVYFFNMFFSTFYHACDQEIRQFCIFKYDGLQLSDFIGSYASFVVTLITMSILPRSIKVFLFMLGVLTCVAINSRDRFDNLLFIALLAITFGFTLVTWIVISIRKRRMQPSWKRLLCVLPGLALSVAGIVLFAAFETDENYWYIHSLWHIFMATSILFFLPQRKEQHARRIKSVELNSDASTRSVGIVNEGASLSIIQPGNQPDTD